MPRKNPNHPHGLAAHAVAITIGLLASVTTTSAETITVCAKGCVYTSINAAIDAASNGDVIQLSAETYFEGEQINTRGKAITLRGVLGKDGEPASVLDGAGAHRVLWCGSLERDTTILENLVIQNGYNTIGGGMILDNGCRPTLNNCMFRNNTALAGGGMAGGSSPNLTGCTFLDNSAHVGGGIYNDGSRPIYDFGSSPTLTECTFSGNSANHYGGGMYNYESSPTLTDCTFSGNSAEIYGSGMYNYESSTILTDCTFTECCQIGPPRSITDLGGNDYDSWCDDCRADVNCRDNEVNAEDLEYLLDRWDTDDPQCDLDGDGVVRAADFGLLFAAWGPCD